MTAVVRTVLGDVEPAALGFTYAHEHLILDAPLVEDRFPEILLNDVDAAVAEVDSCAAVGVGAMVDAMPAGAGRDVVRLAEVSRRTGVHVIATTGLHSRRWYPGLSWANEAGIEAMADLFVEDIENGIDRFDYRGPVIERTNHRAGLIKVGSLHETPDGRDGRVFAAAAQAHRRTGVPVLTHCEGGRGGLQQIDLLMSCGVPPDRMVLSHTDKVLDTGYHRALLETGAFLEYDQALRQPPDDRRGTAWLIAEMAGAGYLERLMVGTDGARRSMWKAFGGTPGLAWLASAMPTLLARQGLDEGVTAELFVLNPARFFSVGPRLS